MSRGLDAAHARVHASAHALPRRKLDIIELSFFNNSRAVELVHSFLQKGALHDMSFLQVCLGHCRLHGTS